MPPRNRGFFGGAKEQMPGARNPFLEGEGSVVLQILSAPVANSRKNENVEQTTISFRVLAMERGTKGKLSLVDGEQRNEEMVLGKTYTVLIAPDRNPNSAKMEKAKMVGVLLAGAGVSDPSKIWPPNGPSAEVLKTLKLDGKTYNFDSPASKGRYEEDAEAAVGALFDEMTSQEGTAWAGRLIVAQLRSNLNKEGTFYFTNFVFSAGPAPERWGDFTEAAKTEGWEVYQNADEAIKNGGKKDAVAK